MSTNAAVVHSPHSRHILITPLCQLQKVAGKLLEQTGGSPLMIRVVAGLLREDDIDGHAPVDVATWERTVKDLDLLLRETSKLRVKGYSRPMLAYELSVKKMGEEEKQLLAVLRHFAPVQEVATQVLEVVWQGLWSPRATFSMVLKKIQRMNVVDVHQREYYGFKYSVLLLSFSVSYSQVRAAM
jgi:hypothetical protein